MHRGPATSEYQRKHQGALSSSRDRLHNMLAAQEGKRNGSVGVLGGRSDRNIKGCA